jgi:hypothetical protein
MSPATRRRRPPRRRPPARPPGAPGSTEGFTCACCGGGRSPFVEEAVAAVEAEARAPPGTACRTSRCPSGCRSRRFSPRSEFPLFPGLCFSVLIGRRAAAERFDFYAPRAVISDNCSVYVRWFTKLLLYIGVNFALRRL